MELKKINSGFLYNIRLRVFNIFFVWICNCHFHLGCGPYSITSFDLPYWVKEKIEIPSVGSQESWERPFSFGASAMRSVTPRSSFSYWLTFVQCCTDLDSTFLWLTHAQTWFCTHSTKGCPVGKHIRIINSFSISGYLI